MLAVIPARRGSKGLRDKNLRELAGRPLVAWTLEAARAARSLDRIVLSSEDEEILAIGRELGAEAIPRPAALARDRTRAIEVVHHILRGPGAGYDYVALLQPTSPLRKASDIDGAVELCLGSGAPACVSVCPVAKSPNWIFSLATEGRMEPLLPLPQGRSRRQDLPAYYELNGAVYVARCDWLLERDSFLSPETLAYVMPRSRSIDIDGAEDLAVAELLMQTALEESECTN